MKLTTGSLLTNNDSAGKNNAYYATSALIRTDFRGALTFAGFDMYRSNGVIPNVCVHKLKFATIDDAVQHILRASSCRTCAADQ